MKARSIVLSHIQKPLTMFGIPVPLIVLTIGAALFAFVFLIIVRLVALSFVSFLLILTVGLVWSYRLAKDDWHVVTVYQASKAFWGNRRHRILVTGRGDEQ